jgi:hypothetical protein
LRRNGWQHGEGVNAMQRFNLLVTALVSLLLACAAGAAEKPSGVVVDRAKRTVSIDCKIAQRKMDDPRYQKPDGLPYPIEVIACWPFPKGQKAHETVVTIDIKPSEVHKALESLGLKPGTPVMGESNDPPQGPEVNIYLEVPGPDGKPRRVTMEQALFCPRTNKPMPKVQWRFTGSVMSKPDPSKEETVYGADLTGTLISIFPVTNETVFQTNLTMKYEKFLKLETTKALPKIGTPVKLVIEVPATK